jgi:exoribonuclease-2
LRWIAQDGESKNVHVRHLKEGMSRLELIPLHLPIPELASHPRMTRAEVVLAEVDLLQLSAAIRVLGIEVPEKENVEEADTSETSEDPVQDASSD